MQGVEGMGRDQLMGFQTAMTMEREGCFSKPFLACCICSDMCKNDMYLHAGALDPSIEVGKAGATHDKCIGHTTQPKCGGFFTPTINIMDRAAGQGEFSALAKVEGPCFFGGCSELCCDSQWNVSRMTPETWDEKINLGDMAIITKKKPGSLASTLREMATDSDTFTMEFKPEAQLTPQQKATMIASLLLVDYMFFEQDNGMLSCEGGKVKITLCETYCCGSLCPWNISIPGSSQSGDGDGGGGGDCGGE